MLYPRENEVRGILDLGGIWKFAFGDDKEPGETWNFIGEKSPIAVPASFNEQKEKSEYRNHCGWVFYERKISIPAYLAGQRRVLRFDGVTHNAKVYLNGKLIGAHRGGFLPFEIEITDLLKAGESASLTVAVDNQINHSTLPIGNEGYVAGFASDNPGIPSVEKAKRAAKKKNLPNFDFFNYAGIQRPVRIYTTPKAYIRDVTLVPEISGKDGKVLYHVVTDGKKDENRDVSICIYDADGKEVAAGYGEKGILVIPNANFWWPAPGTPYLYHVVVAYGEDKYELPFGIRTVEVKDTGFFINGSPFYFKGFGKHEDCAIHGRGLDLCLNVKDVNLIHWLHANSFRTSHYPYAEEMYELCDREGIVIVDEVPVVGFWSEKNENPYEAFSIKESHKQVLKDMVERDKNHPCVVLWSMGNEPDTEHFPESAYDYWHSLYEYTHELDPQNRPVTFVCCQNNYEKDIVTRTMDVVCINRYYGWYNLSGDLDAACYAWNIELDFWKAIGKPVMITEYGADTVAGIHNCVPEMFSEEFQMEYFKRINEVLDSFDFIVGEQVWNFADFATLQGCMRVDGNKKGLLTRDRRPKLAAHYFRQRWETLKL